MATPRPLAGAAFAGSRSTSRRRSTYDDKFGNKRFVPVLSSASDERFIPLPLKDHHSFRLDEQYDDLYHLLTNQPATPTPKGGTLRHRPPLPPPVPASVQAIAKPAAPDQTPPQDIAKPYPGLAAFKPGDCRFFFGREKDTTRVVERLEQIPVVSVVGGSGTGKSSLVAARVVPALRKLHAPPSYQRFKPQADPFRQLAETLDQPFPSIYKSKQTMVMRMIRM